MAGRPGRTGPAWVVLAKRVKRDEPNCRYCGKELRYDVPLGHPDRGCVDHIVPLNQGGAPLDRANLAAACHHCNGVKRDRTPEQWRAHSRRYTSPLPRIS